MKRKTPGQTRTRRTKSVTPGLASFSEFNPNAVGEVGADGRVNYLNPAARRLFPDLEVRGLDHPWLADWKSVADAFRSGRARSMLREVTIEGRCYEQALYWVASTRRVRFYSRDITKRKRAEEDRERLLVHVEQQREHAEKLAETLQAERDIQDTIMENTRAQLAYLDPQFNFVRVNSAYTNGCGHSKEELIGRNHFDWFPDSENQAIFEKVRDTGEAVEFRAKPFQYADQPERGITFWDWTLVPVKSANDRVLGLVLSLLDVTDSKRAEMALKESEERYRLLVETMNEGLSILNQDDVVTYVNDAFCRMVGYGLDEVLGRTALDFLDSDYLELVKEELAKRRKGESKFFEIALNRKDGERVPVIVAGHPIFDHNGDFRGAFGVFTDITALKQAEEALRASKDELERIVTERTRELRLANARLRSLTHDMVSTQEEERRRVARELHDEAGQALTTLKLNLQMMRDELPVGPATHRRRMDEAASLTDKTLEQIRILAQGLRPPALESAGLDATLEGLCSEFAQRTQIQIDYTGVQVQGLGPATICLYRFLQEALTNAARHGHATEIHVHLQRDAEHVCLLVEDNGEGFDTVAVLEDHAHPKGIGLVGMQERLKMVGGWLEIYSEPGQGARLIAHVPLEET